MNRYWLLNCVALILSAFAAFGQAVDTATVVGTVSDPTGALVSGATVRVTHVATNTVYRAETNAEGYYRTPPLRIGEYTIEIEAGGFKKTTTSGLILNVGDVRRIDFTLQVGQITETIAVTAQAPLLQTTEGSAGTVIENKLCRIRVDRESAWPGPRGHR